MTIAALGEDDFLTGLQALLPRGAAWPRDPEALLTKLLSAIAAGQAAQHARTADLSEVESDPALTDEMLEDWERAYGLPDLCNPEVTDKAARRSILLAKIIEGRTPSLPTIEEIVAGYGVTASITEHRPHTCEDHCEYPIYDEPWIFAWTIFSAVGDGLAHQCTVRRIAPAHTVPIFTTYRRLRSFFIGLPAGDTLRRPGAANYVDYRGKTQSAAANVRRLDYAALTYNQVPNPWGDGSPPTNWQAVAASSVTPAFLASGVRDGIYYTRWRVQGTSTGSSFPQIRTALIGDIPAVAGNAFSGEAYVEVVRVGAGNTAPAPTTATFSLVGYTSGGAQSEISASPAIGARTFASGPARVQRTMSGGTTASALLRLSIPNASGLVHDWDVEIGFPILAPGLSYLADSVPLATLANRLNGIPQYGLRGMLVEPSESEQLILDMPDGIYDMTVEAGTVSIGGTNYEASAEAIGGFGVAFVWPPDAVTAGEKHVQTITLIKVS